MLLPNTGGATMAILCKDYKPRDKDIKQNCPNCIRWAGSECINHSVMVSEIRVLRMADMRDREIRGNRGVWIG